MSGKHTYHLKKAHSFKTEWLDNNFTTVLSQKVSFLQVVCLVGTAGRAETQRHRIAQGGFDYCVVPISLQRLESEGRQVHLGPAEMTGPNIY